MTPCVLRSNDPYVTARSTEQAQEERSHSLNRKWATAANSDEIHHRSLVPREADQLLAAGRWGSAAHEGWLPSG
jgi:hypothetical protein